MTKREELVAERAELVARNEAATGWGAAVGARYERIKEIDRELGRLARASAAPPEREAVAPSSVIAKIEEARDLFWDIKGDFSDPRAECRRGADLLEEAITILSSRDDGEARPCTCHPDDNPPVPCARKYAYSECVGASEAPSTIPADVFAMKEACKGIALDYADRVVDRDTKSPDTFAINAGRLDAAKDIAAAISRIPVPPSPVQDEAVAWLVDWEEGGEPVAQAYRSKEAAERAAVNIQSYRANYPAASITPLFTRPPAKADAGEIDVPGKTAGEPATIKDRPSGGSIWQAFANLYGNGNLDDEDCAYIDRELVKWRGEKFSGAPAPAAEQGVSVEELANSLAKFVGWGNEAEAARALLDKYSIRSTIMTEGK